MILCCAFSKFLCRKCGVGLSFRPKLPSFPCRKNAGRAKLQALAQTGAHFELEVMSPATESHDVETLVCGTVVVLGVPSMVEAGGVGVCAGSAVAPQPRSHALDDSQASPDDES